jgi:Uma2 family endonuclease
MYSADEQSSVETPEDPTFYIVNAHMGESLFQFVTIRRLVDLLEYYFERLARPMLVAGNQFFHMRQGDPNANIAPDVYVVPDETVAPDEVTCWKVWEHGGKGPCLAIEIVSSDADEARKDYSQELIDKYERLGLKELFRYDPYGVGRRLQGRRRQLLSHFVRNEEGRLVEQVLAHPERARSVQFDFWLVHVPPRTLRLGVGPEGLALFPTRAEAEARRAEAEARRAEAEARRAEEEARRAEEEARRAEEEARRAEEAERRAAELLAELERLKAR